MRCWLRPLRQLPPLRRNPLSTFVFDPTISLGSLLTIGSFLVIVVVYVMNGKADTKVLDNRMLSVEAQMEDIKIELKKLAEILVKQALQENRIANVETRMLMEGQRVDSMENTFRKFLMNRREDGS